MSKYKIQLALLCVILLDGCSIQQQVIPVPTTEIRKICIINNPDVRESFLDAYIDALQSRDFHSEILDESATPIDCALTSTYTANWRWDLALYMAFAEIKVYDNGKEVGHALYDSLGGSGSLSKFISADLKVHELVDQLFPNSTLAR